MEEKEQSLTEQQKAFCEEYIQHWNATEAYKAAYKSCKSYAGARANASRLLKREDIQAYIEDLQTDLKKQVGISKLMLAKGLKEISFSKDQEIRASDKIKAMVVLAKMFGWEEPNEDDGKFKGTLIVQVNANGKAKSLPNNENDIVDFTKNVDDSSDLLFSEDSW